MTAPTDPERWALRKKILDDDLNRPRPEDEEAAPPWPRWSGRADACPPTETAVAAAFVGANGPAIVLKLRRKR